MVEKPLALTLRDALAIHGAAKTHHIEVLVNYETTWYSSNRAVRDLIRDGKLGDLRKLVIHDGHQGPKEIGVPPEFLNWIADPKRSGGGALFDFGCYGADLATWWMKGETPLSVTAVAQTNKPEIYPNVDDDATIVLQYRNAQAICMASWNWPFNRKDSEVYGTKGYAITVGSDRVRVRYNGEEDAKEISATPLISPHNDSLHYLAAVVNHEIEAKEDLSSLDTNLIVMQILDAARESAHTGRTIKLEPLPH
jgi:predicted dehydrogenase